MRIDRFASCLLRDFYCYHCTALAALCLKQARQHLRRSTQNNLVKGRRDFVSLVEQKLSSLGFVERIRDRSRYLSKL